MNTQSPQRTLVPIVPSLCSLWLKKKQNMKLSFELNI